MLCVGGAAQVAARLNRLVLLVARRIKAHANSLGVSSASKKKKKSRAKRLC